MYDYSAWPSQSQYTNSKKENLSVADKASMTHSHTLTWDTGQDEFGEQRRTHFREAPTWGKNGGPSIGWTRESWQVPMWKKHSSLGGWERDEKATVTLDQPVHMPTFRSWVWTATAYIHARYLPPDALPRLV